MLAWFLEEEVGQLLEFAVHCKGGGLLDLCDDGLETGCEGIIAWRTVATDWWIKARASSDTVVGIGKRSGPGGPMVAASGSSPSSWTASEPNSYSSKAAQEG